MTGGYWAHWVDYSGHVQQVIARGDLSSARNPSAALLARIRDALGMPS